MNLSKVTVHLQVNRQVNNFWRRRRAQISWCHVWKPSYRIWSSSCIIHFWDDLRVCPAFRCCLAIKREQNTAHQHGTDSSGSPRTLTSWEPFVHHIASSRLCTVHRWFTPGAWCPMSGLSGLGVVDLLQAVIRECWAHAGRPSRPGTGTRPPLPPPPSAPRHS